MTASATNQELKQEINQMKRRIAAIEKAFDSIATKDDVRAIEEAHEDLKQNRTTSLSEAKKKYSEVRG
jgi:cell division septum initiation protein DivIVA